uniref:E3 UFM1-protein ligase 1 homolog n=1 Tax=Kalanchoe fedtschenkoi TaxID=63787 RepID=A0A7N0RA85_KALFE
MDEELLELQRQFESAQQAKSSIRLSDRNVVELVQKLQELRIIDFELLHTVSGKEYITPDKLRSELVEEIKKRGRISVIDLADMVGVDLYHVEKQAEVIVSEDPGLMMVHGEIISQSYWDTVAEEINDRLQECSQIALAELAGQLQVGSELMAAVLEPRLGSMVKGRLEGGQLYTPGYVARVGAMVRGAARALTVPTNLSSVWSSLQQLLQETDVASGVAVEGVFFQSLFNGLLKEGEILGSLRAGTHWTPTVFAIAQKECVDSFFSQNSFISYDALHKLAIPQPAQYLQSRYPEGLLLVTLFVHPSMIEMLNAAANDAIEHGTWFDALSVLPTSFGSQDASKILSLCPSVHSALKTNKALTFGESYVFSDVFIKDLSTRLEKEMETMSSSGSTFDDQTLVKEPKGVHEPSRSTMMENANESGNKSSHEKIMLLQNQREMKGKESQAPESKGGAKNSVDKAKEESIPSEEWIMDKIMKMVPDLNEQGMEDPGSTLRPVAAYLRPKLNNLWKDRRRALFTENIEKIRRVLDTLQKKLDEPFLVIQLYEKALDLFEDDPPTSVILHKHLLRTAAAAIVDILLVDLDKHNRLKNGIEVEEKGDLESAPLTPGDRISIAKTLPGSLLTKALAVVETLEGKRVEAFITAVRDLAEESGLTLKKLDKKLERTLLHSYRKDLTSQVSAEIDPVPLLPKVVSLLYVQVHSRALQAPGRAINACITRLEDKLDPSSYKILLDYHRATVTLLALMSASTGDEEDCTSDRILTQREVLEGLMPSLKGLVLSPK